ncbi:MAG: alpha/beta fold hydrolase [Gammaproteobacteria bacterium]|nr:alpha/beta fold hydrolase [Gammaproteobacteria bacterium]MCY4324334.1 alpha/beta fold hydrolase [Gammaproteobacteria bacterium]
MATLHRAGRDIYFEVHGEGPALLLSHGFSATSRMWTGQLGAFSQVCSVVLWDMCGHGQSDSPREPGAYSEDETVEDMKCLLDHLGHRQAIVGGLSLGGYMSLAFHAAYPDYVQALLIFDTGPGFKRAEPREAWNTQARTRADQLERDGLSALDSMSVEMARSQHRSAFGLAMAARHMLVQSNARIIESLPGINVPSLVLVGEKDAPFIAATDYMANKIPNATKVVIKGAGHVANIDRRQAFNRAVLDFLKENQLA